MNFKVIVEPKTYGVPDIHPKIVMLPLKSAIKIDLGDEGKGKKMKDTPFGGCKTYKFRDLQHVRYG